ncbi:MAG: bifunctional UDP-N-acetylglucosamine diphosphorylase/glucosamine-1-phosphate N-acetyltransferase GlmU [Rickettsiales bacterium]|nr:bifunctional UDP-N-acetylglucosamine diphosphorylase/glucosamine-1-phosphate N-acetyltransferase GlmU [Rickettsiales bacterium]
MNPKELPPFCAIILAAGKGTRMKSQLPKVMHSIAGFPMLWHVLQKVRALEAQETVVVVGPHMETVAELAKATFPECHVSVQKDQLGTGHAVQCAEDVVTQEGCAHVVLYGDTPLIRPQTIARLLKRLERADLAILGMRCYDPKEYGRLIVDNDDRLQAIVEYKDASWEQRDINLCNSGVMAVAKGRIFELLKQVKNNNAKGEFYLTDLVAIANAEGLHCVVEEADEQELLGVNAREELAVAEAEMQIRLRRWAMAHGTTMIDPSSVFLAADTQLGKDVIIEPNVVFGTGVVVEDEVEIRAFSHITGATIGRGSIIGPFARLRPGAVLMEDVHVGNFVEIKKATLHPHAKVNHLSYVGDAVVGSGANLGAGTITCNYDGFAKHQTHIGKGAFIGSNTALVAPVSVGDFAIVGAGSTIVDDVAAYALVTTRAPLYEKAEGAKRFREKRKKLS